MYESGLTSANAIQTPSTAFLADSVPIKNMFASSVIILQHQVCLLRNIQKKLSPPYTPTVSVEYTQVWSNMVQKSVSEHKYNPHRDSGMMDGNGKSMAIQ